MDSTTHNTLANTLSISGIFAYLMQYQAEITLLVLITALVLNVTRLYSIFIKKKK